MTCEHAVAIPMGWDYKASGDLVRSLRPEITADEV